MSSWWQDLDRAQFSAEIATRFALNKAEARSKQEYRTAVDRQNQARKGGQHKAQRYGVRVKFSEERRTA